MIKKKFSAHILSFVFKTLCSLIIMAVVGIFLWRIFSSGNPASMKRVIPNKTLCEAYLEHDRINIFTQKQNTITRAENNSGYFAVTEAKFYEEAEQVQLVFRYNDSTLRHLKDDYNLDMIPDKSAELYDITLTIAYDLTPDDTSDNEGNDEGSVRFERIHPTYSQSEQKNLYSFRKFVFDGIKVDDSVLAVYVDIYYNQDIDYEKEAYGTLIIYDYKTKKNYATLSRSDRKVLDRWITSNCGE